VYTVITTIQKVETSFNFLWRVDRPRSFARRFTEYLAVMILGPILFGVALGLLAGAERSPFARWLDATPELAWTLSMAGRIVPYAIVTVIFTFMYIFIPNTKVQFRAALIGGITSGIIWALVGKVFTAFIVYSSSLVAIYTGFAIVLTTLIWVYLSWLILLIGAQLAFYLQFPQYLRHGQDSFELTGRDREQVAVSVMYLVARDYAAGKNHWTAQALAAELDIPSIVLAPILHCLEQSGLIVATEKAPYVPGRDLEAIRLSEIFDIVRALHSGRLAVAIRKIRPAIELLSEVESAMLEPLKSRTLKDLIIHPR
jgi:membrane protein